MLPDASVFTPPVATLTSLGSTWAEARASFWLRSRTVLICIFGCWPARLENDVRRLVVLWDCRFRVGAKNSSRLRFRPRVRIRG
jgi:hypothetical protein